MPPDARFKPDVTCSAWFHSLRSSTDQARERLLHRGSSRLTRRPTATAGPSWTVRRGVLHTRTVAVDHRVDPPTFAVGPDGRGFRTSCSCGWRSQYCVTAAHAA